MLKDALEGESKMQEVAVILIELPSCENAPQTIVKNRADIHISSIVIACMPIQMHHGKAVLTFVPDPRFSALRFVAVYIGQAMR